MNLILFGSPGSGKGTQSDFLVRRLGMSQLSTGDLFRSAIKNKTPLGIEAQAFIDQGQLVPDSIVIRMVEEILLAGATNFILDGFPRTLAQAEALDLLLSKCRTKIDRAVFLDVPTDILLSRLTGRRVCKKCGKVFHVESNPSKIEGICDFCGSELIQRNDDKQGVIQSRLDLYRNFTSPLREFYKKSGIYIEVNGNQNTEEVYKEIEKIVK